MSKVPPAGTAECGVCGTFEKHENTVACTDCAQVVCTDCTATDCEQCGEPICQDCWSGGCPHCGAAMCEGCVEGCECEEKRDAE